MLVPDEQRQDGDQRIAQRLLTLTHGQRVAQAADQQRSQAVAHQVGKQEQHSGNGRPQARLDQAL